MKNKKIVFFIQVIMLLLINLTNLYGQTNSNSSFTGKIQDSIVGVPISTIKIATIKLIERNEYKEISSQKDSIIENYKKYISLQDNQIENLKFENYQLMIQSDDYIRINEEISESLNKQKRLTVFASGVASAAIIVSIVLMLVK